MEGASERPGAAWTGRAAGGGPGGAGASPRGPHSPPLGRPFREQGGDSLDCARRPGSPGLTRCGSCAPRWAPCASSSPTCTPRCSTTCTRRSRSCALSRWLVSGRPRFLPGESSGCALSPKIQRPNPKKPEAIPNSSGTSGFVSLLSGVLPGFSPADLLAEQFEMLTDGFAAVSPLLSSVLRSLRFPCSRQGPLRCAFHAAEMKREGGGRVVEHLTGTQPSSGRTRAPS